MILFDKNIGFKIALLSFAVVIGFLSKDLESKPRSPQTQTIQNSAQNQSRPTDEHAAHRALIKKTSYKITSNHYVIPEVELINRFGSKLSLDSILKSDKPVLLNFIFTTCTTICPVMTATFSQMRQRLIESGISVQLVSISIDPEYDRPKILKAYGNQFDAGSDWLFLTGTSEDVSQVANSFNAYNGSKMNHKPLTFLKKNQSSSWLRIEGLASASALAKTVNERLSD